MRYNSDVHHRKSIRLKGYDYSQAGAYFVTICTQNRECLFGEIVSDGRDAKYCARTEIGEIAQQCWQEIPQHYPFVKLDEFIVMPNHVHGIIMIQHPPVGANNYLPLPNHVQKRAGTSQTIGAIIRGFKIGVTKWCRNQPSQIWQRNYYEHIIRNEKSLNNIREYIINNPTNWEKDELYEN